MTRLTVVGVGPGPVDLITLRGLHAIQGASALAYVRGPSQRSRALAIVDQYICASTQLVDIPLTMSSDSNTRAQDYHRAGRILAQVLINHHQGSVVLLCLGDPSLYGSWVRIVSAGLDAYRRPCDVVIVPGVSSLSLAFATMAQPMALDNQQVRFVTGKTINATTDFSQFFADDTTVAVFKPAVITQQRWKTLLEYVASDATMSAHVAVENLDSSLKIIPLPLTVLSSREQHHGQDFQPPYFSLIIFQRTKETIKE